jgi:bifunctional DNA-binding transcriptional regulator/antitoxin component of YhaV-PrlF toxin-antitoxin module
MTTGIIRKIDDLGRVVLPRSMCRANGFSPLDKVEILTKNGEFIIRKPNPEGTINLQVKSNDLQKAVEILKKAGIEAKLK